MEKSSLSYDSRGANLEFFLSWAEFGTRHALSFVIFPSRKNEKPIGMIRRRRNSASLFRFSYHECLNKRWKNFPALLDYPLQYELANLHTKIRNQILLWISTLRENEKIESEIQSLENDEFIAPATHWKMIDDDSDFTEILRLPSLSIGGSSMEFSSHINSNNERKKNVLHHFLLSAGKFNFVHRCRKYGKKGDQMCQKHTQEISFGGGKKMK